MIMLSLMLMILKKQLNDVAYLLLYEYFHLQFCEKVLIFLVSILNLNFIEYINALYQINYNCKF